MRTQRSIKNLVFASLSKCINFALNFVLRSIVIYVIGVQYLGVDMLFANILAIISFAEMGVGGVVSSMLYEPLAKEDYETVKSLIRFLRNFYLMIGGIVLVVGLSIVYFIPNIVSNTIGIPEDMRIIYVFYLINTLSGYFYFYKTTIFIATQNQYLESGLTLITNVLIRVAQCLFLYFTKNYYVFLFFMPMYHIVSGLVLTFATKKKFPYLSGRTLKLSPEKKKEAKKRTFAAVTYKLGGVLITTSDALVITLALDPFIGGIYSNYVFIITSLNGIMALLTSSIVSSVGNAVVTLDPQQMELIFKRVRFIVGSIISVVTVCLFVLFNIFMDVWVGPDLKFGLPIVLVLCLNFFISQNRAIIDTFKFAAGLYVKDKFRPLIEGALNLVISIVLVKYIGVLGVALGTLISAIVVSVWSEVYILYKHLLKCNMLRYFKRYALNLALTAVLAVIAYFICNAISVGGWGGFVLKAFVCLVSTGTLYIAATFWLSEFKYATGVLKSLTSKIFRKKHTK